MYHSKKRIRGHQYWYLQRSRRIGKKVKTESFYVAPVSAAFSVIRLGVALATKQAARDKMFKDEIAAPTAKSTTAPVASGLAMSRYWSPEELDNHDNGIKSGATSAAPSSDAGGPPSGSGDAT